MHMGVVMKAAHTDRKRCVHTDMQPCVCVWCRRRSIASDSMVRWIGGWATPSRKRQRGYKAPGSRQAAAVWVGRTWGAEGVLWAPAALMLLATGRLMT